MFAWVGICFVATSFTSTSGARIKSANLVIKAEAAKVAETEDSETGPDVVTAGVRETEVRHCALFNFQSFAQLVDDCDGATSSEDAMAEAIQHYGVVDTVTMSRNDALSLATMNTTETYVDMALCGEGQPANFCVQSLPAILWLRQFWRFEDLSAHAALSEEDQVKARIINRALNNFGISASRLHSKCERDVESPAFEIVRECVVDSLPTWAENHTVGEITVGEDHAVVNLDHEALAQNLEGWLRNMWQRDDVIRGLHHSAGYFMRSRCSAARTQMEQERHGYEASILATGFPLVHGVTQVCNDETPSMLVASGTLERIIQEISVCSLNDGNCTAAETPCPEGFTCDCQRRTREGSGLVAGAVIGGIAGLAVSTAVPFAVAGAAGLAFAPEYAAAWAYGSLLLGGKVEVAGAGAAIGTLESSTTCMCFPVECEYNEESEQCEMTPSATASASSNPFSTLPFTGLKCTEHRSHHWFHSGKECALTECDRIDTSHAGPVIGGHQFFGRVGRSSDWEETGVYNCANTEGTVETLLTRLQSLPQNGAQAGNTVENRIQILQQYSN